MLTKLFISEYIVCVISGTLVKGDILYSNDDASTWDPDMVDVCGVVAYEVPNMGPRLQLLNSQTTLFQNERVCTISKDFQVRQVRSCRVQLLIWCHPIQAFAGRSVGKVASSPYHLWPKVLRELGFDMDCMSLNHDHPSRLYSSTILHGRIRCRCLKVNSFICYPSYKFVAQTSFSIAAHTVYLNIVLSFDICHKLLNSIGEFRFGG